MTDTFETSAEVLAHHYEGLNDIEHDFRNRNLNELVASLIRGSSVLDVGAGGGFLVELLTRKGRRVIGIEPNMRLIELAKNRNGTLDIRPGGIDTIHSVVSDTFDSAIFIDVLEHLEDDKKGLRNVRMLLKEGGIVIAVVPAYQWLYGRRDRKYGHFRRYSKSGLKDLLISAGFEPRVIRYWNTLGVLPYWFSEKIRGKELETNLRHESRGVRRIIQRLLFYWFRYIENSFHFGFGLSLIAVAETKKSAESARI